MMFSQIPVGKSIRRSLNVGKVGTVHLAGDTLLFPSTETDMEEQPKITIKQHK